VSYRKEPDVFETAYAGYVSSVGNSRYRRAEMKRYMMYLSAGYDWWVNTYHAELARILSSSGRASDNSGG